jgi:addiction module RelE/StbE family toxin
MYRIIWDIKAIKDLAYLSEKKAENIRQKVTTYLIKDPLGLSSGLTGRFNGERKYRYGDYRIVFKVDVKDKTIKISRVGHRSEIYL